MRRGMRFGTGFGVRRGQRREPALFLEKNPQSHNFAAYVDYTTNVA
jgi:hypothetical protein